MTAGNSRAAGQFAEQPDRLDAHPRRAAGDARPLPADRHLDHRRRGLRARFLRRRRRCLRAELPRHRRARRSSAGGAQLLEELPDDRLAPGLDRRAAGVAAELAKLIEFNTSCAPVFVQRAALAALGQADATVRGAGGRLRPAATRSCRASRALPGIAVAEPAGGLYAFFARRGRAGFAGPCQAPGHRGRARPGAGRRLRPRREGWLRWCFASRDPARLVQGVERLERFLGL